MKLIGVVGLIGSGKGTFADHVSKSYGYEKITYGDILRELTMEKGLDVKRENLIATRKETLEKYGDEYIGRIVAQRIEGKEKVVNLGDHSN